MRNENIVAASVHDVRNSWPTDGRSFNASFRPGALFPRPPTPLAGRYAVSIISQSYLLSTHTTECRYILIHILTSF